MRTLVSVLEAAVQRAADEVTLESEQPVIYRTPRGSEAEQVVLQRPELFDMLAAAVSDEHQVELMLGNAIEFTIDAGAKWIVRAVPGVDAMVVRAERTTPIPKPSRAHASGTKPVGLSASSAQPASALEIELEAHEANAFDVGDPDFDIETEFEASAARTRREPIIAPTLPDDDALELPPPYDEAGASLGGASAPFESGTWALEDDDDEPVLDSRARAARTPVSDSAADSGTGRLPQGFPSPPEPSYELEDSIPLTTQVDAERGRTRPRSATGDRFIGVPIDDDEDPFANDPSASARALRQPPAAEGRQPPAAEGRQPPAPGGQSSRPPSRPAPAVSPIPAGGSAQSPTVPASTTSPAAPRLLHGSSSVSARAAEKRQGVRPQPPAAEGVTSQARSAARTRNELSSVAAPNTATRRELSALGSPEADTHRELPSVGGHREPELVELAADIGEGCLVYIPQPGMAEHLAEAFQAPAIVIDDEVDPSKAWARVRALPPGAILIIKREDPSALLGWILRRLEEGYRVFLETRARSAEGARRILLGTGASERAEAWLSAQDQLVIEPGVEGPRLRAV